MGRIQNAGWQPVTPVLIAAGIVAFVAGVLIVRVALQIAEVEEKKEEERRQ
jgi:hypothetical protein